MEEGEVAGEIWNTLRSGGRAADSRSHVLILYHHGGVQRQNHSPQTRAQHVIGRCFPETFFFFSSLRCTGQQNSAAFLPFSLFHIHSSLSCSFLLPGVPLSSPSFPKEIISGEKSFNFISPICLDLSLSRSIPLGFLPGAL